VFWLGAAYLFVARCFVLVWETMETNITSQTDTLAVFTVTLGETELQKIKAEVFNQLRSRVKASGFRPGKAPDPIVERELGSATVQSEVIDHALQHSYADAIRQHNLNAIGSPQAGVQGHGGVAAQGQARRLP
jgi:trigger factor